MIAGNRSRNARIAFFLLALSLITQKIASQDTAGNQAVPDGLRRPERGEAPRYPKDLVIGELGRGEASEGAYLFARNILAAIAEGRRDAQALENTGYILTENIFDEVRSLRPRSYRLGGGKTEVDGCVSFLVRIIGQQESITGELFIRWEEAAGEENSDAGIWFLDDLILEEKRTLADIRDSYRYDFSPYERFY